MIQLKTVLSSSSDCSDIVFSDSTSLGWHKPQGSLCCGLCLVHNGSWYNNEPSGRISYCFLRIFLLWSSYFVLYMSYTWNLYTYRILDICLKKYCLYLRLKGQKMRTCWSPAQVGFSRKSTLRCMFVWGTWLQRAFRIHTCGEREGRRIGQRMKLKYSVVTADSSANPVRSPETRKTLQTMEARRIFCQT